MGFFPSQENRLPVHALLVLIAVFYSGAFEFLAPLSPFLLYAFYLAVAVCTSLCALGRPHSVRGAQAVLPYLAWVVLYFAWGTVVSPDQRAVVPEVVRALLRTGMVMGSAVVALAGREDLVRLARVLRFAILANVALSVWEVFDPSVIEWIAFRLNPDATAWSITRPASLWSNPNEAAYALLFGLLLSYWDRGWLAWLARAAAVLGIALTVSRSGIYLTLGCGLVYLIFRLRSVRPGTLWAPLLVSGVAGGAAASLVLLANASWLNLAVPENAMLERVLDVSEGTSRDPDQDSRAELAGLALRSAMEAPWCGYGVFSFQGGESSPYRAYNDQGVHNVYIAVFGEVGFLGLASYLLVLVYGVDRLFAARTAGGERLLTALLWLFYLTVGIFWHNEFTSPQGVLFVTAVYHLPGLLARPPVSAGRLPPHEPAPAGTVNGRRNGIPPRPAAPANPPGQE